MKFTHILVFIFLFVTRGAAQQNHFIYIQTENKQPFYVKMADRLLSSSSVGYLVIPKLQNGKYEIGVGFPKNEWPLQKITVTIRNNDAGYILKNFESKGWGLFNMQTMDVVMSAATTTSKDSTKEIRNDGFADVLADVVSTPSIKEKPVTKEVKEEKAAPVVKSEPVEVNKTLAVFKADKPDVKEQPVKPAAKLSSTLDTDGRYVVYVDTYESKLDTIRLFIPYKVVTEIKETIQKPVQPVEAIKKEETKQEIKAETKQETRQEATFIDMELQNPNKKADSVVAGKKEAVSNEAVNNQKEIASVINKDKEMTEPKTEPKALVMVNSDCKTNATEEDFLKLRKKMAAESTDDEMIAVAKKAFKSKCYSTEQVSNLSVLFLKDEGRYNFFDAAYPRVGDTQNFGKLVTKLTDEYYVTRFNAMIRH